MASAETQWKIGDKRNVCDIRECACVRAYVCVQKCVCMGVKERMKENSHEQPFAAWTCFWKKLRVIFVKVFSEDNSGPFHFSSKL